jgi:DNA-binding transcriptional LysR family regulator
VVLLHRTTRTMKLTEQGERYRRDMQLVLDAMGEAERRSCRSAFRDASMSSCRAAWGRSFAASAGAAAPASRTAADDFPG